MALIKGKYSRTTGIARNRQVKTFRDRQRADNPEAFLFFRSKVNARHGGHDFDLTPEDIKLPELCPVLGIPLKYGDNNRADNYPSIDRVVPDKGYVRGNVAVISWRANWLKSNATLDELKRLVDYVERHSS